MSLLVGIGQPLLDIRANVSTQFLSEQKLKPDDAIRVGPERLVELQKLSDGDASYIPGGSCLNTIRVAQWMWKRRGSRDSSTVPRSAPVTASSRSTTPSASSAAPSTTSSIFASIKSEAPSSTTAPSTVAPSSTASTTGASASATSPTSSASSHHFLAHAAIVGAIGADELGGRLKRYVEDPSLAGCVACFQELASPPNVTGTCLALVVPGGERSMVTMFGASEHHSIEHLSEPAVAAQLADCEIVMLEAFYLLFNSDLVLKVAREASAAGKRVVINISSTFVITTKTEVLREILSYCNVIIGNKGECEKLGLVFWPSEMSAVVTSAVGDETDPNNRDDVRVVGQRLLTDPKPKHTHHPRIVLITQGFLPTLVWHSVSEGTATLHEFPVHRRVSEEDVVDTIGAGDSFMAGFLSQLAFDAPLAECIDAGHYAAAMVVRHAGCTFDDFPDFVYQPFIPLPAADGVSSTAPQSPSFYARSFSPFASPSGTPVLGASAPGAFAAGGVGRSPLILGHTRVPSHHLAPLSLPPSSHAHGSPIGSTTPASSSSLATSSSTSLPPPPASPVPPPVSVSAMAGGSAPLSRLSVQEAAEAARLRKIARKHQDHAWAQSQADRLAHYHRIAAIRARILDKESKCSDEERKLALLSAAQEDEWNQLAAQHGRWQRYGALQQKAAALAAEQAAHADAAISLHSGGVPSAAPHTPPHTERKLGLSRVHTPTLSTTGASAVEVHEYYRRANRLLRAFDLRAGALRQLTSEETRKVLSTEGLAYLAHGLTQSVSRAEFAERYARQGLPDLPFFPAV